MASWEAGPGFGRMSSKKPASVVRPGPYGYFSSTATKSARIGQRTATAADGDDDVEVVVFDEAVNLRGTMV